MINDGQEDQRVDDDRGRGPRGRGRHGCNRHILFCFSRHFWTFTAFYNILFSLFWSLNANVKCNFGVNRRWFAILLDNQDKFLTQTKVFLKNFFFFYLGVLKKIVNRHLKFDRITGYLDKILKFFFWIAQPTNKKHDYCILIFGIKLVYRKLHNTKPFFIHNVDYLKTQYLPWFNYVMIFFAN